MLPESGRINDGALSLQTTLDDIAASYRAPNQSICPNFGQ
jgi:hypothetical protein